MTPPRFAKRDLSPSDPYYPAWQRFAATSRGALWRWFGVLATGLIVGLVLTRSSSINVRLVGIAALWLAPLASFFAVRPRFASPCPRCGGPFLGAGWRQNGLARACVTCKLPKWAPDDPARGSDSP